MNERTNNMSDSHRTHLYIVNGLIVDSWDYTGKQPTVSEIKSSWRFHDMNDVTDDEISDIIGRVARFYN